MSTPKVPPHIAKQLAAMKAAPAAGKPAAPAAPKPAAPARPGSLMAKVAIAGWVFAGAAAGAAYFVYTSAAADREAALAEQAARYDGEIAKLKADNAAALKKVTDDATAATTIMQTELDFAKMPELPLETTFRANQVLYVENKADEVFACKVRLFRPLGGAQKEVDFTMKARTYQDIAALGDWLFAKGDKIEFVKPGFKPRQLVAP